MPRPRSAMRQIREVLRLRLGEKLSGRQVSAALGLPLTTVWDYVNRAQEAGFGWPLPEELDDAELEAMLFASAARPPSPLRPLPDWAQVHREIRRKGVTLQLLNLEYAGKKGVVNIIEDFRQVLSRNPCANSAG